MNEMCEKCEERLGTIYINTGRWSSWLCAECEKEFNESIIDYTEYQMGDDR